MRVEEVVEDVVVIHDFLSEAECAAYRERADQAGYGEAPINNGSAFVRMESVRNNERVMIDDMEEAARLWARMAPLLPASWQRIAVNWYDDTPAPMDPVGLNERLRIYRYLPGQYFKPHSDARFVRTRDEFSMLTVLLYLNGGFEGGQTRIIEDDYDVEISPRPGLALIFRHDLRHEGVEVRAGEKYVLRTDVMYRLVVES
jgi:prolyl 4-hydroxylase